MMKNKIKNILNDFIRDGFVEFNSLLDKRDCSRLYNRIKNSRDWGPKLFNSEKKYIQEFKNKPKTKLNPGKGIQNLVDQHNLEFIEKNKSIIQLLKLILGEDYEIMLSKFVVAVPNDWMPTYVKKHNKNELISNFDSGGYSSKLSLFEHMIEETNIRINNKQNKVLVLTLFILKFFKHYFKI